MCWRSAKDVKSKGRIASDWNNDAQFDVLHVWVVYSDGVYQEIQLVPG